MFKPDYIKLYNQAEAAAQAGKFVRAKNLLITLRGNYPRSVSVLILSARVEPNTELAIKFLSRAYAIDPTNPAIEETARYLEAGKNKPAPMPPKRQINYKLICLIILNFMLIALLWYGWASK